MASVFGKRLKQMLWEKEITQKSLAQMLGMTEKSISSYVRGHATPTLENLAQIAKILNISTDYLVGAINEPRPLNSELTDDFSEEILMIRRSYAAMSDKERKAIMQLTKSLTSDED